MRGNTWGLPLSRAFSVVPKVKTVRPHCLSKGWGPGPLPILAAVLASGKQAVKRGPPWLQNTSWQSSRDLHTVPDCAAVLRSFLFRTSAPAVAAQVPVPRSAAALASLFPRSDVSACEAFAAWLQDSPWGVVGPLDPVPNPEGCSQPPAARRPARVCCIAARLQRRRSARVVHHRVRLMCELRVCSTVRGGACRAQEVPRADEEFQAVVRILFVRNSLQTG